MQLNEDSVTKAPQEVSGPAPAIVPETLPKPVEIGGPAGPEPTRFGDWDKKGRCIDF